MLKFKKFIACLLTASFLIPNVSKGEAKADTNVTTPPLQQTCDSGDFSFYYIGRDGKLYATGYGSYGALGNGTTGGAFGYFTKSLIPDDEIVTQIDANIQSSAIALTKSNNVYVWGKGANLSNGSDQTTPMKVNCDLSSKIIKIGSYKNTFCLLDENGKLFMFGNKSPWSNSNGNLTEVIELTSPDGSGVKDFVIGERIAILSNDGNLYVAGDKGVSGWFDANNQSTTFSVFTKVDIPDGSDIKSISSSSLNLVVKTSTDTFAAGNLYHTNFRSSVYNLSPVSGVDGITKLGKTGDSCFDGSRIWVSFGDLLYASGKSTTSYTSYRVCINDDNAKFIDYCATNTNVYGVTSNGEIYVGGSNRDRNLMQGHTNTILKMVKLNLPSPAAIPSSSGSSSPGDGTSSGDIDVDFTQKDTLELTIQESEVDFGDSHSIAKESTLVTASVKSSLPYSVTIKSNGNFVEQGSTDSHEIPINNLSYKVDGSSDYIEFENPNTEYLIASGQSNTTAEPNKTRDHRFQLKLNSLIGEKKGSYKATLQITATQS